MPVTAPAPAAPAAPVLAASGAPRASGAPWRAQFFALAAIWGSSFLCIKVLGEVWAPLHVAFGRVALGAAVLVVVLAVRRERLPRDRVLWAHLAVAGLLMNAVPYWLFAFGETLVTSVVAGLWNGTTPLLALLVALLLLPDERPDRRKLIGLALGFVGVTSLLAPWRGLGGDALLGHLACLGAAACYGLGVPYTRRHLSGRPESGVALAGGQLVVAMVVLAAAMPLAGAPSLSVLDTAAVASLLVMGVLGTGLAYVLTHRIVRAAGATTFSTVTYVVPVVSTALGVLVLGEALHWNEPAGALVVLTGIAVSSTRRPPGRAARRPTAGRRGSAPPARRPPPPAPAPARPR